MENLTEESRIQEALFHLPTSLWLPVWPMVHSGRMFFCVLWGLPSPWGPIRSVKIICSLHCSGGLINEQPSVVLNLWGVKRSLTLLKVMLSFLLMCRRSLWYERYPGIRFVWVSVALHLCLWHWRRLSNGSLLLLVLIPVCLKKRWFSWPKVGDWSCAMSSEVMNSNFWAVGSEPSGLTEYLLVSLALGSTHAVWYKGYGDPYHWGWHE